VQLLLEELIALQLVQHGQAENLRVLVLLLKLLLHLVVLLAELIVDFVVFDVRLLGLFGLGHQSLRRLVF